MFSYSKKHILCKPHSTKGDFLEKLGEKALKKLTVDGKLVDKRLCCSRISDTIQTAMRFTGKVRPAGKVGMNMTKRVMKSAGNAETETRLSMGTTQTGTRFTPSAMTEISRGMNTIATGSKFMQKAAAALRYGMSMTIEEI